MGYERRMKILFITNGFPPNSYGGVQVYTRRLAIELAKHHKVSVFCREADLSRDDYSVRNYTDNNVKVSAVNYNFGDLEDFAGTYFIEPMREVFSSFLEENGVPDIVHVHHLGGIGYAVLEELDKRQIPIVLTLHDFSLTCPRGQRIRDDYSICEGLKIEQCLECLKPQCKGDRGNLWKLYRYLFRKKVGRNLLNDFWTSSERVANLAWLILAPSEFHAQELIKDGFPSAKIRVMPYGYEKEKFSAIKRDKIGLARNFGYLGSLIPSKGVHVLIEAFNALVKEFPDLPLKLHLYGPAPSYHGKSDYPLILRQLAGDRAVFFHGAYPQEQLAEILATLDAVVVPSVWWETHGMVVREAKLAGLPVVISDIGALGEGLRDGIEVLKAKAGNPKSLRDKMRILAITPGLADFIASNQISVKDIKQDAFEHQELYLSLLTQRRK